MIDLLFVIRVFFLDLIFSFKHFISLAEKIIFSLILYAIFLSMTSLWEKTCGNGDIIRFYGFMAVILEYYGIKP